MSRLDPTAMHLQCAPVLQIIFLCLLQLSAAPAEVRAQRVGDKIDIELDSRHFTSFHFGSNWPKPFLHPLRSPSGVVVTRGFPVEEIAGETRDHRWHRGLFFGHGDIQGIDFWREIGPEKHRFPLPVGTIVLRALGPTKKLEDAVVVTAIFDLLAPGQHRLGSLRQHYRFHKLGKHNAIDARITLTADAGQSLKMGDTEEGTFAIRVAPGLRQDKGATLRNAQGLVGTENIWGKASSWVDYSGRVGGKMVGIAIFDHPSNPKHPTHWHARGYGLFSANPFGEHDFYGDSSRDGSLTIEEGETLALRYRVVVHEEDGASIDLESLYRSYSAEDPD